MTEGLYVCIITSACMVQRADLYIRDVCVGHCSWTHGIVPFDKSGVDLESSNMKCTFYALGQFTILNSLI